MAMGPRAQEMPAEGFDSLIAVEKGGTTGARRSRVTQHGPLAQQVEQLTLNQQVQGSSPWRLTKQPI